MAMLRAFGLLFFAFGLGAAAYAQARGCNVPAVTPSLTIKVGPKPFTAVASEDGCRVYVSLLGQRDGKGRGIAVLRREGGRLERLRLVPLKKVPTGIVLSHDGKLLVAAAGDVIYFLNVDEMQEGSENALLGELHTNRASQHTGNIYANVTNDDRFLFVSEENAEGIAVIDLARARKEGFTPEAILGTIPVGQAPIALTFSADERLLYTTSELAAPSWGWPNACPHEGSSDPKIVAPEGAVIVIDVARAVSEPANSVLSRVPAGCSPVRLALSPQGDRVYVTARNSNALLIFDTLKLTSDDRHALIGQIPVGTAPVPVAVVDQGHTILVGNSNRFEAPSRPQKLTAIDATKVNEGSNAILGSIAAGGFPREMRLSSDWQTVFLTNFGSDTLQMIDVKRMPLTNP